MSNGKRVLEGVFAPLDGGPSASPSQEFGIFKIRVRWRTTAPEAEIGLGGRGVRYFGSIIESVTHPKAVGLGVSFVYLLGVDLKVTTEVTVQGEVLDFVPPDRLYDIPTFLLDAFWVTCWDLVLPAKRSS